MFVLLALKSLRRKRQSTIIALIKFILNLFFNKIRRKVKLFF